LTRLFRYILIIGTAMVVYYFLHYYVYISLFKGLNFTPLGKQLLKSVFVLGAFTFVLGEILSRRYDFNVFSTFGSIWLGMLAIAITILLFKDLLVLIIPGWRTALNINAFVLIMATTILSVYNAGKDPVVKDIHILLDKQVYTESSYTIVHLSDIHISSSSSKTRLEGLVNTVNGLNADAIVITGDLIDDKYERVKDFSSILRDLSSHWGTFAVTGNHEYYAGIDGFRSFSEDANISILHNSNILLGDGIVLAGVDDSSAKDFSLSGPDLDKALSSINDKKVVILLSHKPENFEKAAAKGVDIQLSGHTHAGQIPPMNMLVSLAFKYRYGLYKYESSFIHTSPGTSTWGPPMRLFSKNEIVRITISTT